MNKLLWERLDAENLLYRAGTSRAKVPGGWLIALQQGDGCGITFYPDEKHTWDGQSLP
jgi:hypothetical protein